MKIVLIYIVFFLHAWSSQGGTDVFKVILFLQKYLNQRVCYLTVTGQESLYYILLSSLLL